MKTEKKKKKSRRTCLEHSQLKTLFDVLRRRSKCDAATEYIAQIDEEFDVKKKKKVVKKKNGRVKKRSWIEEWL